MTPSTEQIQKATQHVVTAYEEIGSMARDHFDATLKSANAASKGWDELARSTSGMFQETLALVVSTGKTIMGARSLREVAELQNEIVKDMFDNWVASTNKLSEISARVTQDVVAPIAEHTNTAFHKIAQKVKTAA